AVHYAEHRSLIRTIKTLGSDRKLKPIDDVATDWLDEVVPDSFLIDPERPLSPDQLVEQFFPGPVRRRAAPNLLRLATLLIGLVSLLVVWRCTPVPTWFDAKEFAASAASMANSPLAVLWVIAGYTAGSILLAPITLLIIATGVTFGPLLGFIYALCGSCVSA